MVILTLSRLIIVPCGRLRHRDGFNPHFIDEGLEAEQPTEHPRGPTARGSVPARASRQGAPLAAVARPPLGPLHLRSLLALPPCGLSPRCFSGLLPLESGDAATWGCLCERRRLRPSRRQVLELGTCFSSSSGSVLLCLVGRVTSPF